MESMRTSGTKGASPRETGLHRDVGDWGLKSLSYHRSRSKPRTANSGKAPGGYRHTQKNLIMRCDQAEMRMTPEIPHKYTVKVTLPATAPAD